MTQRARVLAVEGGYVTVAVMQASACMGCHAAGSCSVLDKKQRTVVVPYAGAHLEPGDEVWLVGTYAMGAKAVLVAFVLPLILLLVAVVVALKLFAWSEPNAIFFSLGVLALYYLLLIPFRSYFERKLRFTIEKITPQTSVNAGITA